MCNKFKQNRCILHSAIVVFPFFFEIMSLYTHTQWSLVIPQIKLSSWSLSFHLGIALQQIELNCWIFSFMIFSIISKFLWHEMDCILSPNITMAKSNIFVMAWRTLGRRLSPPSSTKPWSLPPPRHLHLGYACISDCSFHGTT